MEKIHERKPKTYSSVQGPQKPCHLYVNKRTERITREMARIPQPIQFQNHISTRKRGKETGRPYQKTRGHTHNRKEETREEIGNTTTKGNMLGHAGRRGDPD